MLTYNDLTTGQRSMFDLLDEAKPFVTTKGFAGTGKSTGLVVYLRSENAPRRILFTAPTHKATGVLRQMINEERLSVDVMTIQSALDLRLRWKEDEQILVPGTKGHKFGQYDMVCIDEASMLGDNLMSYIVDAQADAGCRVVFLGDPAQLPPVDDCEGDESASFLIEDSVTLKQIMRQSGDSNIPALGEFLRESLNYDQGLSIESFEQFADGDTVELVSQQETWDDMLEDFATAEDDVRYLSFTNKVVDKGVAAIRRRLYGPNAPELMAGEKVAAVKPILNPIDERPDYPTDTLVTIDEISETVYHDIPAWKVRLGMTWYVVIKNAFVNEYKAKENELRKAGKKNRKHWPEFYRFVNGVAWLRPAQAMTVHKSQGSTFDRVYVNLRDVLSCRDRKTAKKLAYVACTRPRTKVVLMA